MQTNRLSLIKHLSITTGLYRPARWLSRRIRPAQLQAFRADVNFYRRILSPGSVCFDVGANIGEKSEALLRSGAARVVSFEPDPVARCELRARCGHFENWVGIGTALGRGAAIATLHARGDSGKSSFLKDWTGSPVAMYHVPVVTLDSAIECFGRPDYCKVDVEGWEPEVFKGLTLSIPLISFEFHLGELNIPRTVACLEHLRQLGGGLVNITPAETPMLHLKEWMALDQFAQWFPGDLKQTLPGDPYGDIWIRMNG